MSKQIICEECTTIFYLSNKQLSFYSSRGFSNPKRCPACREKRRRIRLEKFFGIEEVMQNHMPLRRRKQRVHYAPHIVGGFR